MFGHVVRSGLVTCYFADPGQDEVKAQQNPSDGDAEIFDSIDQTNQPLALAGELCCTLTQGAAPGERLAERT